MISTFKEFHEQLNQPVSYSFFSYANENYKETYCYHEVFIGKKSGGTRTLQVPNKKLKWLQRQLLPLLNEGVVSSHAFAYKKKCGILDNAMPHTGKPLLVKLDIENFFGSITFSQVFHAIDTALAGSHLIGPLHSAQMQNYNGELSWYFTKICTLNGVLPQGAPTSPILSNMVFFPLDNIIASYCNKRGITYTRYSDDLTFSGDFSPSALISFVRKFLSENGFKLNDDKTVVLGHGKKHLVTGACVNERVQAPRDYRRKIRQEMYFLGKYGIDDVSSQIKKIRHLLGQINFVLHLDPTNKEFDAYKADCLRLLALLPLL